MDLEFENEKVHVKVTKKPACLVELNITTSSLLTEEAKNKAIKNVKKEISISGFRKGKAPDSYIITNYPKEIEAEWKNELANLSFLEAEKLVKIYPLSYSERISYNLKKYSEEGAELTFTFETEPTVPTIDIKKFKLKEVKEKKFELKDVDELIRQSRFFYAKWNEVDRPIKLGDYVILDIEALDVNPPKKIFSDVRFEIKEKSVANWMKDVLIDAKKNDIIETISKPDKDLPKEEKTEFEEKRVRITVKKIEEAILPPLDDSFAKKMGKNNVEDLKKAVEELIKKMNKEKILKDKIDQINQFLLKNYPLDLPKSLLEIEFKTKKEELLKNPEFKKDWDLKNIEEKKEIEKFILNDSRDAVTLIYLIRKIFQDEKIKIEEKEIKEKSIEIMKEKMKKPEIKTIPQEYLALAFSRLCMEKVYDHILKNC
ncbi:MAG: hypothetical protein AMS24_00345 [Chlamydiae bacterium SM23_39]|nr:MAG: hypothetical protein AMS24_00345 [Chlamydiae bacterium SM23_39]